MGRTEVVNVIKVVFVLLVQIKVECRERRPSLECAKLPRSTPLQIENFLAVVVELIAEWNAAMPTPSIFHFARGQMTRPTCRNVLSRSTTDRRGVALCRAERSGAMISLPRAFGCVVVVGEHEMWDFFPQWVAD